MSLIRVENLTFNYPSQSEFVFENISFQIDTNWKLGFIGRNGKGKSTLLHLLMGKYEYRGKIHSSVVFDYFPYPILHQERLTKEAFEEIAPRAETWELLRELSYLEVKEEVLDRPFDTLSSGEQTKVLLAALFLNEGHFLLIDEPTNHLDRKGRELVSAYLNRKKGFILVSHDRSFLDRCVDHILSFNRNSIDVQSGNYSSWFLNFQREQEGEFSKNQKLIKEIARMKESAEQSKRWSQEVERSKNGTRTGGVKADKGYLGHKAAKMMKRSKSLEARQMKAIEEKSSLLQDFEVLEELRLSPLTYHSDTLLRCSCFAPEYDGKKVCHPFSLEVKSGERIAIEGKNGSGKSSFLKFLVGEAVSYAGECSIGSRLRISYVPQDTSFLKGSLKEFITESGIDETLFKAILRKMDFSRLQWESPLEEYSAGQKKKVLLAKSLCEQAHLYIWDEPLNYIDVHSRIQIEQLIKRFTPTMIFVEHDESFRATVATKILELE